MHQFFIEPGQVEGDWITIMGPDVNHIRNVLRMRPGEPVRISDGSQKIYEGVLEACEADRVTVRIQKIASMDRELPAEIYLFQGLPKSDKLEWIIQKCVELGVQEITPVKMKRCVVKLEEKKEAARQKRWQAIAESAAKQAGRDRIPQIGGVMDYSEVLQRARELDCLLVPYEQAEGMERTRRVLAALQPGQRIGIVIGPEGGFEEAEVEAARQIGAEVITLGKRILRTETAGMALLSMIGYCLEP